MQDLNLTSAFYVFRESIPHLRRSKNGRIVAIGSLSSKDPQPDLGAYVHIQSRALPALVQIVALENADSASPPMSFCRTMAGKSRGHMPNADFSKWLDPKRMARRYCGWPTKKPPKLLAR